jgi:hypothetical protein
LPCDTLGGAVLERDAVALPVALVAGVAVGSMERVGVEDGRGVVEGCREAVGAWGVEEEEAVSLAVAVGPPFVALGVPVAPALERALTEGGRVAEGLALPSAEAVAHAVTDAVAGALGVADSLREVPALPVVAALTLADAVMGEAVAQALTVVVAVARASVALPLGDAV